MEFLGPVLDRKVVIALAIVGAGIALLGGYLLRKKSNVDPRVARFVLRLGYGISWASVALFIAVGFAIGR